MGKERRIRPRPDDPRPTLPKGKQGPEFTRSRINPRKPR